MTFDTFYHQYFDRIFNYIFRRTLHYDNALDITQETFIKALRHFAKLEAMDDAAAKSYLYKIAGNCTADHYRTRKNKESLPLEETIAAAEQDWNLTIEARRLIDQMRTLPEQYQEVLHLRLVEDLPYADIAQILDKNESTLRSLLKRGVEMLRQEVAEPQVS